MPSALVTGHNGFMGQHLTAHLRALGWEVVTWPDDVRHLNQLRQKVEVVFHLAAKTRLSDFATHEAYQVNLNGTLAVLNYCHRVQARLILTSTSGVYQPTLAGLPITESTPIQPTTPYALSKWLAEQLCWQQCQDYGLNCRVMRLFNVYGVGQPASFLMPYLIDCLTQRKPLTLRMPEAIRDFIAIEDVMSALVAAAEFQGEGYHVFNVGTGQGTRVIDLVAQLETIFEQPAVNITLEPTPTTEITISIADIRHAQQHLAWQPHYTLETGLRQIKQSIDSK